jgi:hypothetical protein
MRHHQRKDALNSNQKRRPGKYVPAWSWHESTEAFLRKIITERPLLHVCSGPTSDFGDMRVDMHCQPVPPGIIADWLELPFANDSYAAVFADPPWDMGYMKPCADFCKEALRIAPVAYVMSPWYWCHKGVRREIWVRDFPGIHHPILIVRYEREQQCAA